MEVAREQSVNNDKQICSINSNNGDPVPMTPIRFQHFLNNVFETTIKHGQVETSLKTASFVISEKLHSTEKKIYSSSSVSGDDDDGEPFTKMRKIDMKSENDDMSVCIVTDSNKSAMNAHFLDVDIEEASRNTRRNAQYSSMASNVLWYFAYYAVYGKDPPTVKGSIHTPYRVFPNGKREKVPIDENWPQYSHIKTDEAILFNTDNRSFQTVKLLVAKASRGEYIYLQKEYVEVVDNSKKDSYTAYQNKDWSYEMVKYITENMHIVIDHVFNKYRQYGTEYDEACNRVIHCQKFMKTKSVCGSGREQYKKLIYQFKVQQKTPAILSKLYSALILESDLEMFLNTWILKNQAPSDFKDCDIKLLHNIINYLINARYTKKEALMHIDVLSSTVKDANYMNVLESLRVTAIELKYRKFSIPELSSVPAFHCYNYKEFKTKARHTECIECFATNSQLTPQQQTHGNATFLYANDSGRQYIYDAINLPTKSYKELSQMSWSERLMEAEKYVSMTPNDIYVNVNFIKVHRIDEIDIQFDKIPKVFRAENQKSTYYIYFSTRGLGRSTNFVRLVTVEEKCKNPTPNPRQKRPKSPSKIMSASNKIVRKYQMSDVLITVADEMKHRIEAIKAFEMQREIQRNHLELTEGGKSSNGGISNAITDYDEDNKEKIQENLDIRMNDIGNMEQIPSYTSENATSSLLIDPESIKTELTTADYNFADFD